MALNDAMRSAINSASCKPLESAPFITWLLLPALLHTLPTSLSTLFVVHYPNLIFQATVNPCPNISSRWAGPRCFCLSPRLPWGGHGAGPGKVLRS